MPRPRNYGIIGPAAEPGPTGSIRSCQTELDLFVASDDRPVEVGLLRKGTQFITTGIDGPFTKVKLLTGSWLKPKNPKVWRLDTTALKACTP